MKQTIGKYQFVQAFDDYNRGNNFSIQGREALFDWLEGYEEDCGEEIELDVIALCCEYSEYDNIEEFWNYYDKEDYPTIEDIENETMVIMIDDDSFIIQCF